MESPTLCLRLVLFLSLGFFTLPLHAQSPVTAKPVSRQAAELMAVDEAFCREASRIGILDAFIAFAAEGAIFFDVDPRDARGREVLEGRRERWKSMKRLSWKPLGAEVAESGELGYTWGESESESVGADGKPVIQKGLYVSIWKKASDGSWRYVLDTGSGAPARRPATPATTHKP